MNIIKWLDNNIERFVLICLLILMTIVMFAQVSMRYVFGNSLSWAEELTRYCFIFSTFFSISFCIKKGSSLRIDMVLKLVPESVAKILDLVGKVLVLVFFVYFAYVSIGVTQSSIVSAQKSPALQMPMYLIYLSVTLGFSLSVIRSIQSLILTILNYNKEFEI